jgi:hypothetical protein
MVLPLKGPTRLRIRDALLIANLTSLFFAVVSPVSAAPSDYESEKHYAEPVVDFK